MFNPQFWWVNKSALRGPTTCSNPVGIMDCGGLGIKANNKDNIYQSWMRSRYKQGNSQGNSFPVRSNMWIGVSGHSFIHSFIDQLTNVRNNNFFKLHSFFDTSMEKILRNLEDIFFIWRSFFSFVKFPLLYQVLDTN